MSQKHPSAGLNSAISRIRGISAVLPARKYQKDDGGFSHNIYKGSSSFMGGQNVGIGLNEANVDANGFGVSSTIRAMLSCFEIGEYRPPMYYTWNYMKFIDIVLSAKHRSKKRVPENFLN